MDEALLRDALRLDEDWLDRDENGVAHLPTRLPSFIKHERLHWEVVSLESAIDRLGSAGCRRQVLYFCLKELSPAAEQSRRGRKLVRVGVNTDPEEFRIELLKWAPKEDLKVVANQAKRTLKTTSAESSAGSASVFSTENFGSSRSMSLVGQIGPRYGSPFFWFRKWITSPMVIEEPGQP